MIQAKIKNFRGIRSADIDMAESVTVIGADNGAGKSSIAQSIAAAATGNTIPFDGMTKKDAQKLIHDGSDIASVVLFDGVNGSTVKYPECSYATVHDPIMISESAAGLNQFSSLKQVERIQFLTTLLDAFPSKEQLSEAIKVSDKALENIWNEISINGWDNAVKIYSEKRLENKLQWQIITGEKYGSKKADGWLPESWDMDLIDKSEDDLMAELKSADEWVDASIRSTAVGDSERERLNALADNIAGFQMDVAEKKEKLKTLSTALEDIKKSRSEIPKQSKCTPVPCPGCGIMLVPKNNTIVKYERLSDSDIKKNSALLSQATIEVDKFQVQFNDAEHMKRVAESTLEDAKRAKETLSRLSEEKTDESTDVESAKKQQEVAIRRLTDKKNSITAGKKYDAIELINKVLKILQPNGLRKECIEFAFKKLNAQLGALSKIAGWDAVHILTDGNLIYSGIPFALASESEQYRVDAVFQVLISGKQKAKLMIVDRADCLLKKQRDGLITLIKRSKIPTVVLMAISSKEGLLECGGDRTYWIQNEEATEING